MCPPPVRPVPSFPFNIDQFAHRIHETSSMAWIVWKSLKTGATVYLVRYRTGEGKALARQFDGKRDADAFVHKVESEKVRGELFDQRLGKMTLEDWIARWIQP